MSTGGPSTGGSVLRARSRVLKHELRAALAPRLRGPKDRLQRWVAPGLSEEMNSSSPTLLIAFGGMRGNIGMPPFEFFSMTRDLSVKRMFVRDLHQAWYHRGTRRHGTTLLGLSNSLRDLLEQREVERLVVVGNSAGGYAALAFGTLLGADAVLAFAPQTVLEPDVLAAMGDRRWNAYLDPLVASGHLDPRFSDLRAALPQARIADTRYEVFFDHALRTDRLHAERLAGVDGVRLYRFADSGHYLVRALRESGALEHVLARALGGGVRETRTPSAA